jgi:hypothetical protein
MKAGMNFMFLNITAWEPFNLEVAEPCEVNSIF